MASPLDGAAHMANRIGGSNCQADIFCGVDFSPTPPHYTDQPRLTNKRQHDSYSRIIKPPIRHFLQVT